MIVDQAKEAYVSGYIPADDLSKIVDLFDGAEETDFLEEEADWAEEIGALDSF